MGLSNRISGLMRRRATVHIPGIDETSLHLDDNESADLGIHSLIISDDRYGRNLAPEPRLSAGRLGVEHGEDL